MAAAVDVNDNFIVAGCDNAVIGVWDAADASEINLLAGELGKIQLWDRHANHRLGQDFN